MDIPKRCTECCREVRQIFVIKFGMIKVPNGDKICIVFFTQ